MDAGIYTIPAEQYHSDPAPHPSLSASLIKSLIYQSPLHAYSQHPRLNPAAVHEEDSKFDIGTAAHALVLEGVDKMAIIHAEDWRTKAAKEARDDARARGMIPILTKNYEGITRMVGIANAAVANCPDLSGFTFAQGRPEQTLLWQEGQTWCRARPDMLANDHSLILDYKTTSGSASPDKVFRQILEQLSGDIQAAFYRRGLAKLTGKAAHFVFMTQEIEEPYAVSFVGVSPAYLALGEDKVEAAIKLFAECLTRGQWPGYERRINWAEPKNWSLENWYQKQNEAAEHDQAVQV